MSDLSDHPPYSAVDPEPWKAVFVDVANGTPDEPTKAGLLALVRHGKVVWNAWRNAYPCRVHRAINVVTTVGPKVYLRGHVFQDNVNFAEFLFGDDADFEGVHFEIPPAFHNSTLHQDTTFQGAIFPKKAHGNEMCARAYRTLKLAFAQQHAVREEQRFFKLEMAEEAALDTGAKRWLYRVYKEVAGYGFSLIRPFAGGLCLTGLLAIVYGVLMRGAGTTPGFAVFSKAPIDWQLTTQWVQFVLINLLPLPGFDETLKELRSTLFGNSGWWPLLATIAEAMHKICVLLAVFLIGLALRNLFKLK